MKSPVQKISIEEKMRIAREKALAEKESQIVLLIPLFFVWYKRPTPFFKYGRVLCISLIFPASIYLFFVTIGVFDLLPF